MLFSSGVRFQRRELVALDLAATISRSRRPARRDRCKTDERGGGSPQVRSTSLFKQSSNVLLYREVPGLANGGGGLGDKEMMILLQQRKIAALDEANNRLVSQLQ